MYISTANYRQNFQPGRTHAIERQIKRLVLVNVGESKRIYKLNHRLGRILCELLLERP